jgi:RNA polymerase sigma-70 factor (ECF subfamily)
VTVLAILATLMSPPIVETEDDDLLARFRRGDTDAFAAIYRAHVAAVYRRLTSIVGPIDEREDLVQDVFLALHRTLPRFRGDAQLATLIHRIAVNAALDQLRRHRRRPITTLPEEFFDEMIAPGTSPEVAADQRQELAVVFASLSEIKPKKRVALLLHHVEGLTFEEIGRLVDATADTVAKRVQHAQRELETLVARARRRT